MTAGVVIVGAGQAGFQVAASLRGEGHAGPILLLGAEDHPPYQRPPLSKGLLLGKMARDRLLFRQPDFYAGKAIDLRLGQTVTAIDRAGRTVTTAAGTRIAYEALVLATGTRVRPLPLPGVALAGVAYLRTLAESEDLARRVAAADRVVVIGGGFIGLEVAAAVRMLGKPVTVLEAADRLMGRVVAPVISDFYADLHRGHGVELVLGARIAALEGSDGQVRAVVMADGTRHAADLVVIGIGVLPNVELAQAAGLACANGIVVDDQGAHRRSRDLRRRRVHQPPQPLRRCHGAPGIGPERGRPGQGGGRRDPGPPRPLRRGAVVLERPVRRQAADGGAVDRPRPAGGARRPGDGPVLRVLLPRRPPDRHRFGQPCRRPHDRAQAPGHRRQAEPGGGRRRGVRAEAGAGQRAEGKSAVDHGRRG